MDQVDFIRRLAEMPGAFVWLLGASAHRKALG